jgi:O-antigen/teichoic acid export membrane protein
MTAPASQGRLLARNTVLNLFGQVLPAVTAVVLLPYTVHGLGIARFGILSLAWILVGYLSLFDLGLGRATIRFVSDALGRKEPASIPAVVWTSFGIQLVSGSIAGVILALLAPVLIPTVIKVPGPLVGEGRAVVQLLGLVLPVLICSSGLKGVLEAHQRFDLVNIVRSAGGTLMFAVPAAGVALGLRLPGIMLGLDAGLLLVAVAYLALDLAVAPSLRDGFRLDRSLLRPLFAYGGWVTVSSVIVPVLVYADRLLLSALASIAVLGFYTVPYELVARLQVIPWSFGTALFPALSSRASSSRSADVSVLYARSLKFLLLVMSPLALAIVAGAHPILLLWLGKDFAARGSIVMQLLAVGMLLNALSQVPAQLLDAVGRPDLRAKVFLAYAPVYVAVAWLLIANLGIAGAALGWALRALLELCLFFGVAWRLRDLGPGLLLRNRTIAALALFGAFALAGYLLALAFVGSLLLGVASAAVLVAALSAVLWTVILDPAERAQLSMVARDLLARRRGTLRVGHESTV